MNLLKVYRTVINSRYIGNKEILCRDSTLFKEFALEKIQTKGQ